MLERKIYQDLLKWKENKNKKSLIVKGARFDIIASGSLIEINYKDKIPSYPVGYVEHLEMHSLDFEEFCWANGMNKEAFSYLKEYFDKLEIIPDSIHNKMMELFKEYIVVGGVPPAVNEFITSHNFVNVLKVQKDIIEDYKMENWKVKKGFKLSSKNIGISREGVECIPLYMAIFL